MVYWRRSMGGWFSAPVIRSDGTIYVCWSVSLPSSSTNLTALNATTGSVWWTYQIGGPASQAMPFTPALSPDGSTLYLSCGMRLLCAITASWATSVWNASLLPDNVWTSILLDSGRIFFGTDQGRVCAFAASNGAQTWCKVLSAAQAITTTPMIAVGGSLLYVVGGNGILYALDVNSQGAVVWSFGSQSKPPLFPPSLSANGFAYFFNTGALYAVGALTGLQIWNSTLISSGYAILSSQGMVYGVGSNGVTVALDSASCAFKWQSSFAATPVALSSSGTVYVLTPQGQVTTLDGNNGQ
jgi:outer membrane protein assembly factor BamB